MDELGGGVSADRPRDGGCEPWMNLVAASAQTAPGTGAVSHG
jgi:hypothetical protein